MKELRKSTRFKAIAKFLLILVAIVFFAGLLLPARTPQIRARIKQAQMDMYHLKAAIEQYDAEYGRLPPADLNTNEDVTFGINSAELSGFEKIGGTRLVTSNSDLMVILLDIDAGVNVDHKLNPKKIVFFEPKRNADVVRPGFSTIDNQFRDSWGNPYVISLDLNGNGRTRDAFYASANVSTDEMGLVRTNGVYEFTDGVMIWSRGPDGRVSMKGSVRAGANKDNVLLW